MRLTKKLREQLARVNGRWGAQKLHELRGYGASSRIIFALTIFVFSALGANCLAWNATGHMSIALLTWQKMDAPTRQRVTEILKHHPHYKIYLNADVPAGVSADEWAFLQSASWPDWVRGAYPGEPFKPQSVTQYSRPSWHYIDGNYVVPGEGGKVKLPPEPSTLPTVQPTNAVQAMDHAIAVLADPTSKDEDKAVMLAWLVHLVGDIHQPLHASSEFSTRFPEGDKGGNGQGILVDGKVMNLHAYWDDLLGTDATYPTLAKVAAEVNADPAADVSQLPQLQENRTPDAWARESFALAVKYAYLDGTLQTAVYHRGGMDSTKVPALLEGYAKAAHDLALKRAALASDRLSELLGELLKQ
jgi:S1/P1 Nuclease